METKIYRARIRRRKQTEADPSLSPVKVYTAATCGVSETAQVKGVELLASLKLDPTAISEEESLKMLRLLGLNPESSLIDRSLVRMGLPVNDPFTWDHFCHIWKTAIDEEHLNHEMLEKAFSIFDRDDKGFITRQEMLDQFQELGGLLAKEEIEKFHDILDRDGDGVIDYNEFILAMQYGGRVGSDEIPIQEPAGDSTSTKPEADPDPAPSRAWPSPSSSLQCDTEIVKNT